MPRSPLRSAHARPRLVAPVIYEWRRMRRRNIVGAGLAIARDSQMQDLSFLAADRDSHRTAVDPMEECRIEPRAELRVEQRGQTIAAGVQPGDHERAVLLRARSVQAA